MTTPFHLDGYQTGDPTIESAHPWVATRPDGLPEELDARIVGCGPAGPARRPAGAVPGHPHRDRRPPHGPLDIGRADGVAWRTVEVFEALTVRTAD